MGERTIRTEGRIPPPPHTHPPAQHAWQMRTQAAQKKAFAEWLLGEIGPPQEKVKKQNFCRSKERSSPTLLSLGILCPPKNVIATFQLCQIPEFPHKNAVRSNLFFPIAEPRRGYVGIYHQVHHPNLEDNYSPVC